MRAFLTYLYLELKRTAKAIPYFLAGAIVLAALTGTIAFSAGKLLYGEQAVETIEVGVVAPQEDVLARKVMDMIASMDSVGSLCDFTYVEQEEGERLLKSGELFALMLLPEGLVEGIMDGSNIPVTVLFPESAGLESAVFRELTEAGSSLLRTSQAGIYAADAVLRGHGMETFVAQAEQDLNRIFLQCALSRERYFRGETVSAAGNVPAAVFYGISAAVFLLLLAGIPAAPLLHPPGRGLEQSLARMGIGRAVQRLVRLFCLFCLLTLVSAAPFFLFRQRGLVGENLSVAGLWLLTCLTASAWIQVFFEWCRNSAAAILLLFFVTVAMLFAAGGIVPSVFLPEAVRQAGSWTVTAVFLDAVRFMAAGTGAAPFGRLAVLTAGLAALSAAAGWRKE